MLKKGTRIVKQNSKEGDGHPDGAKGVITGSLTIPLDKREELTKQFRKMDKVTVPEGHIVEGMYQVEWDDMPGISVMVTDYRVKKI